MNIPSNEYINKLYNVHSKMFEFLNLNRENMGSTILNVGLSQSAVNAGEGWVDWFTKDMEIPFDKMYVLELNKDNAEYFKTVFKNNTKIEIIHGDVRTTSKYLQSVDSVFWFHGPEHIKLEELSTAFKELNSITEKFMLWVCPWGKYYNLNIGEYEEDHHWYYPQNVNFTKLGMCVFNDGGDKDTGDANINSYIIKK